MGFSTFLDTQKSFQKAKMKDVCRGDFEESYVRRSGPYLATIQTSCQSEDLEKPLIAYFMCLIPLLSPVL